jgi:hypothetical protein
MRNLVCVIYVYSFRSALSPVVWWEMGEIFDAPLFWAALKCILKMGFLASRFVSFSSSVSPLFWVLFHAF